MKVFDLQTDQEELYFQCLEDWSNEMADAGPHKEEWYRKMKTRGLRVKIAFGSTVTGKVAVIFNTGEWELRFCMRLRMTSDGWAATD